MNVFVKHTCIHIRLYTQSIPHTYISKHINVHVQMYTYDEQVEPNDKAVDALLQKAVKQLQASEAKQKKMYSKMFG